MILTGLADLHKSMKENEIKRYKFDYLINDVVFDVLFFVDESPYSLIFGAKGKNLCFELKVLPGYRISPILNNDTYKALCKILNLKQDKNNPFSPAAFFNEFNTKIPQYTNINNRPKPHEVAKYRKNVEEAEKIYFCGWFDDEKVGKKVRESNLEKTKAILGVEVYEFCKRRNVSTCWTADELKAIEVIIPT